MRDGTSETLPPQRKPSNEKIILKKTDVYMHKGRKLIFL